MRAGRWSTGGRAWAAVAALSLGLLATPAVGVIAGTPVPSRDRRYDCVGIVKGEGCFASGISGSCVLIDAGERSGATLVRGAKVLMASHSLERNWAGVRFRFRRALNGDDDGNYPAAQTAAHCDGRYQEAAIRVVDGVYRVTFPDFAPGATNPVMAVVELDRTIGNIRPAIVDGTPPFWLPGGVPIIVAGWGATELSSTAGSWGLRSGAARVLSPVSGVGGVCPAGCAFPDDCRACELIGLTPDAGPFDLACTGLGALHDSGAPIFRQANNPNSDERGGDLLLLGLDIDPPSTTGGYCRTYARPVWLWNRVVQQVAPLAPGIQPVRGGLSDFDRDGHVTLMDLFGFIQAWFDGRAIADVSAPDGLGLDDVFGFVQSWFLVR